MPCDHLQPDDVVELAEKWLREHEVHDWESARVRHGENTPGGMWGSVVLELERRGDDWIVTGITRNKQPLAENDCGLSVRMSE